MHDCTCAFTCMYIWLMCFHREVNGLYLLPINLKQIWSSIRAQQATVNVVMKAVLVIVRVSTHTHTVILTHSALVIEKVSKINMQTNCRIPQTIIIHLGILCGECKDERKGVSALFNQCVTCGNESGFLILALS